MKCPAYDLFFKTISQKGRIQILELLKNNPLSVSEIVSALGEEQSKISHNLKKLADCHIVEIKQEGKRRIYSLNKETIFPLMSLVEKHVNAICCKRCSLIKVKQ